MSIRAGMIRPLDCITQRGCGSYAALPAPSERIAGDGPKGPARVDRNYPPINQYTSAIWKACKLSLPDCYRPQQLEIERCFGGQGNVAISGQARTAGARRCADQRADGRALAATSNCPDGRSTCGAAAHHGCRALALSFAGHGRTGGLNFVVLSVDLDAGESKAKNSSTLETAGSFGLIHDTFRARTLRNGDLT